ncbi:MAG: TonB-dependent receptor, partial [Saprospiraceae bacterium]|nr:TonB-dependent receptor [Saprospiraceae bacterium]
RSTAGSYDNFVQSAQVSYSDRNFISRSRGFYQTATNDYAFEAPDGTERRLSNADLDEYGLMQENHFRLNDHQQLGLHIWLQGADRQIPPTTLQESSQAEQADRIFRSMLEWRHTRGKLNWYARAAFFRENLEFVNPAFDFRSESEFDKLIGEVEGKWTTGERTRLHFGLQNQHIDTRSTNYEGDPSQNRTALYASFYWSDPGRRWEAVLSARQELVEGSFVPFVPSLGLEGVLTEKLSLKAAVSRNFRLPAFDDRFFSFGGDPTLEPEEGWTQELGLLWRETTASWNWRLEGTAFNRNIDNWIIWLPDENFFFTPRNVQEVWSRGLEGSVAATHQRGAWKTGFELGYDYVRSTVQEARVEDDPALGKQLIYVPKHQATALLSAAYRNWSLQYWHNYTDSVYTTDDNASSLPARHLGNWALSWKWDAEKVDGLVFFRLRNAWDTEYQVVATYPMPGRHYQVGVEIGL